MLADFDQRVVLADVPIFLHVAAGLAQEPHRCAIDGAAQAGANKSAAVKDSFGSRESLVHFLHTGFDFTGLRPRRSMGRSQRERFLFAWSSFASARLVPVKSWSRNSRGRPVASIKLLAYALVANPSCDDGYRRTPSHHGRRAQEL